MGKGERIKQTRKVIRRMHAAGVPVGRLVRSAKEELGVRPRFVYRALGYKHGVIFDPNKAQYVRAWVHPSTTARWSP